jgi:hypothetical protein
MAAIGCDSGGGIRGGRKLRCASAARRGAAGRARAAAAARPMRDARALLLQVFFSRRPTARPASSSRLGLPCQKPLMTSRAPARRNFGRCLRPGLIHDQSCCMYGPFTK